MSCKCRLHVETRWSPTRTWHAVLRRSSKDTTIAIVASFPDTPRAFTASFNVIQRFFKPGRCGLWFFEFSDVEQRFVGSCAAHVRLEPRWQCLKPPSRCELGCMWHKVQLGCKRGAVLSRTSWRPNGHIPKELPPSLHGVGSLRGKLVEVPMCHHNVDQACSEFSEDLGLNGLVCNDGEIVATFLEDTVLLAMT